MVHFPLDIKLPNPPLLEAWLEIRWQLQDTRFGFPVDRGFPYALGVFYSGVRDRFPVREPVFPEELPQEILPPYAARFRFRPADGKWPLLQLGPGVATVNFIKPYAWEPFEKCALYLRDKILDSYTDQELKVQSIVLRYRNGIPFQTEEGNPLQLLEESLNTSVVLPQYIRGSASPTWPLELNMNYSFALTSPKGIGILRYIAGKVTQPDPKTKADTQQDMLMWQVEVSSGPQDAPSLCDRDSFAAWLTAAHTVAHDWFFSLIDGDLHNQFKKG